MSNHSTDSISSWGSSGVQRVKEESQIIQTTVLENRQAGAEVCSHSLTFPAVEERRGKNISPPLSQECCPANKEKLIPCWKAAELS